MPSPICYASKDILRLRVARLTATGAPLTGAGNGYVTDAAVQIERTPRVEEGENHIQRRGDGSICQSAQECDTIVGQDLTLQICTNDLVLIGMLTDALVPTDATGAMGYLERGLDDGCARPVCIEWWSYAWDGGAQASIGGSPQYWHRVVPKVTWVHAATTYARGLQVVTLNGKGSENANITANGPFDDWPAAIRNADGLINRSFGEWRESTLPAAACAAITVSSAAS